MASLFSRRKPKRVGKDESRDSHAEQIEDSGPVVRRPPINTPKTTSKLRLSFNPTNVDSQSGQATQSDETLARRPIQSRLDLAAQRDRRTQETTTSDERPSYSRDYLNELRNSVPSTPQDLSTYASSHEDDPAVTELDVTEKFGQSRIATSSIPSAAEIEEKKQRRSRLAKEQGGDDYIALEDYDSDGEFRPQRMQLSHLVQQDREKDTRLLRDDEDIAEGFDEFVDDPGRTALSGKSKRAQAVKERNAIRELIEDAEDSSEDDSETERIEAYEAAQTSRGMDGLVMQRKVASMKPRPPKDVPPVPKLSSVLSRLKIEIQALEFQKAALQKKVVEVQREKAELVAREEHIQRLLAESGEEFQRLSVGADGLKTSIPNIGGEPNGPGIERGLGSLGQQLQQ